MIAKHGSVQMQLELAKLRQIWRTGGAVTANLQQQEFFCRAEHDHAA